MAPLPSTSSPSISLTLPIRTSNFHSWTIDDFLRMIDSGASTPHPVQPFTLSTTTTQMAETTTLTATKMEVATVTAAYSGPYEFKFDIPEPPT
ncbi:hypothetical protein PFISCL1PPCAC_27992, partial [Pristionchus fissidentatus]